MFRSKLIVPTAFASVVLVAAIATRVAVADDAKPGDAKPAAATAGQGEMKLPPGWTEADMQSYMAAATPGKQHEFLTKGAGTWSGRSTIWMSPTAEPVKTQHTTTVTPIMDGRFVRVETKGEMPGMGPFTGSGVYGYDNVAQKYVATWVDNCSTGILNGTGERSSDGKTITWIFTVNCPIAKKPVTVREVETITGESTKTLDIFCTDPKSGKEYRTMSMELTKQS